MRPEDEIDNLRLDLSVLGQLIDAVLDNGHTDDPMLQACSDVLQDRRQRLKQLEKAVRAE